jgi:hypothetical protein
VVAATDSLRRSGAPLAAAFVLERAVHTGRALLVRCDRSGCRAPVRLGRGAGQQSGASGPLDAARLAADRRWLAHVEVWQQPPAAPPFWQRWYVWGSIATAAAVAAAALAWNASQTPERRLHIVVEPQSLRR